MLLIILFLPPFCFLKRYLRPPAQDKTYFKIPLGDVPENAVYMVRDKKIALIRSRGGLRAVSIACTHLGCTLNVSGDRFVCPCHGSVFMLTGEAVKGPAVKNLRELRHTADGDTVTVYDQ